MRRDRKTAQTNERNQTKAYYSDEQLEIIINHILIMVDLWIATSYLHILISLFQLESLLSFSFQILLIENGQILPTNCNVSITLSTAKIWMR